MYCGGDDHVTLIFSDSADAHRAQEEALWSQEVPWTQEEALWSQEVPWTQEEVLWSQE